MCTHLSPAPRRLTGEHVAHYSQRIAMPVTGAQTNIHFHSTGVGVVAAAIKRHRNTTIAIGADQSKGVLLLDIDVQADVCSDAKELREQLLMIAEALEGHDPLAEPEPR